MNAGHTLLRRGLIGLSALSVLGTAFELATERHWHTWQQLLPWGALALLAVAVTLLALRGPAEAVTVARVLASVVLPVALFGVYVHVAANYEAGFLDQRYAGAWETLPSVTRWWYALTKTVGPTPPLAPGMLAQAAFLVLLAGFARRPGEENGSVPNRPRALRRH
ncbi:hypothetical protein [Streptosporangium sp. NPDC003464]